MNNHFGSYVKKLRTKEGFTSYGLARAIDIDPSYMYRIESGKANPSKGIVKALADALRHSRTDFLEIAGYKIVNLSTYEYA